MTTLQKLRDSTLRKANGRKSQTCKKRESVLLVWQLKGRFFGWWDSAWKTNVANVVHENM